MGRRRSLSNLYNPPKSNTQFSEGHKSKGILDDYAVRGNVATKEGSIEHIPSLDNHIVNKLYCDNNVPTGATGSFTAASGEVVTVVNGIVTLITTTFLILLEIGDSILFEDADRMENG